MILPFPKKTMPLIKKNKYFNPYSIKSNRKLYHYALWQLGYYKDKKGSKPIPKNFAYPQPIKERKKTPYSASWINHSSFLLNIDSIIILTDPIWSQRCSPIGFIGPKRLHRPALSLSEISRVDMVFISHNHYDHLDSYSVTELHKSFPKIIWVVPIGVASWFHKRGIKNIIELSWWDSKNFYFSERATTIEITAVPTQHFSGRSFFDDNKTLWCGFVATIFRNKKLERRFYFVGDTGYNKTIFQEIGDHFSSIHLSLIPIGAYLPKRFMDPVHIDPEQAVTIHHQVHSSLSIGMHWYTFRLSEEKRMQPAYDLWRAMKKASLDPLTFRALLPGDTVHW